MKLLKTIGKGFSRTWNWTNGHKTKVGVGMHAVWFIANLVFKDFTTAEQNAYGHALIGTITTTGIGHKVDKKTKIISNTVNKLKNR